MSTMAVDDIRITDDGIVLWREVTTEDNGAKTFHRVSLRPVDVGTGGLPSEVAAAYSTWLAGQGTPPTRTLNDPIPPSALRASIIAQARLLVSGDDLQGVETAAGFGAAMILDTGVFWLFFTQPQPDDNFGAFAQARRSGGGIRADVTDANTGYIEVTTTDMTGTPVTPVSLFVSIQRAQ